MTVYVLENGCYSDTHVVGIYSSREAAEMAAKVFADEAAIMEYELDHAVTEMEHGCLPWFVRLHRDSGDVLDLHEASSYLASDTGVGVDVHKNIYTVAWAVNKDEAVKIAADRRRVFLSQQSQIGA